MPALGEKVLKANPGLKCVEPGYCFNVYLDGEYRETDNIRESYIDGIWNKDNVDEWLTELQVPVEKK